MKDQTGIKDSWATALDMFRDLGTQGHVGIAGYGLAVVRFADDTIKQRVPFSNIITTKGDEYYAKQAIIDVPPVSASTGLTVANGMKLGNDSATTASKSSTGAALVTYLTGSNANFSSTYPQTAAVGGDGGWNVTYQAAWAAGTATSSDIEEVVIVNDAGTNATSTVANTYARAILTTINKGSGDSLTITWVHKFLGA